MDMIAANGEKVFEYYLDLPAEVRIVIIDGMQADDRCRFTRCSIQSGVEARGSKNYFHELSISNCSIAIYIHVMFTPDTGFLLKFREANGKLIITYFRRLSEQLWETKFDCPADWVAFAIQHFKNILQRYQKIIKKLDLDGPHIVNYLKENDLGIKSLNRLENLTIEGDIDGSQYLSKLRQPLKKLYLYSERQVEICEQIYPVSSKLIFPSLKLDNDQFMRLSASKIHIHIGELTVQNILSFIRSWQNGEIRANFKRCIWILSDSNFDKIEVFKVFRPDLQLTGDGIKATIKHDKNVGQTATLEYYNYRKSLEFEVNVNQHL